MPGFRTRWRGPGLHRPRHPPLKPHPHWLLGQDEPRMGTMQCCREDFGGRSSTHAGRAVLHEADQADTVETGDGRTVGDSGRWIDPRGPCMYTSPPPTRSNSSSRSARTWSGAAPSIAKIVLDMVLLPASDRKSVV